MKVSLKDIANDLLLSKTTVSWVLSGKGDEKCISLATQEKVLAYAKKMNYQPNLLARSLNTGLTKTIGLLLPDISDTFYSEIAREVEKEVEKYNYSLMIASSGSEKEREERMIQVFRSRQVSGIIIAPTKRSQKEILQMMDDDYPFVLIDRYFPELKANYVIIDNEESSYCLVKHLIEKGYRKIALITTNSYLTTMSLRADGYKRALVDSGVDIKQNLCCEVDFINYKNNIIPALDNLFHNEPDVDAFFFTTHILAIEAFNYFHAHNIQIDSKIGLACIHDISSFRVLAPHINTARMPVENIGKESVSVLINTIEKNHNKKGNLEIRTLTLPCTLNYRD